MKTRVCMCKWLCLCATVFVGGLVFVGSVDGESPSEEKVAATPLQTTQEGEPAMDTMKLSSTAISEGGTIPKKYTGDGLDVSPPLKWPEPSSGTKSFALICDDPDAPAGTWVHWVMYGIGAAVRELPEGIPQKEQLPDGAKQGITDFRKVGYNGPAPPPGKAHRYFFKLYALDTDLASLAPKATKKALEDAMKGHVLTEAQLMGLYKR